MPADLLEGPADLTAGNRQAANSWDDNTGLLSNQGEKSINFYFIRVPLRKKY